MAQDTTLLEPVAGASEKRTGAMVHWWDRSGLRYGAPALVLIFATVLNTRALRQNGYANTFYSAGVKSMIASWHNFFFVSFDPTGLVTIDKPPLGLWLQAASAKLFGFDPLSLLLPEALAGVLAVGALYAIVKRRFGMLAALVSSATLAVFPSFVAVSRDNNIDAPLILLMILACGAGLRACENGRLRTLLGSAVLLALAFNTKALAAYLALPPIVLAYMICAPGSLRRRLSHLLAAGALLAILSLAWMLAVDATPASKRPFVGGTDDNSELALTFSYNGIGRVRGQLGGPGPVPQRFVAPTTDTATRRSAGAGAQTIKSPKPSPDAAPSVKHTIDDDPIAFGKPPGPLRLFEKGMGDQGAWLLPFALIGLIAMMLTRPSRRDPRMAALIVLGGFFLAEALLLSASSGIVHPYYLSALGPGCAAMVGCGLAAIVRLRGRTGMALGAVGLLASAITQALLLTHDHYLRPWVPALIVLVAAAVVTAVVRARQLPAALTAAVVALLVAPTAYSLSTWRRPVESTFPAAGPRAVGGYGGVGVSPEGLAANRRMIAYLLGNGPGSGFQLLTESSASATAPILLGLNAAAMGGYGGTDPALDAAGLARLVASGQARYVLVGGGYDYLGGNSASRAAERVCRQIPPVLWSSATWASTQELYLLDCRGRAGELERQQN